MDAYVQFVQYLNTPHRSADRMSICVIWQTMH